MVSSTLYEAIPEHNVEAYRLIYCIEVGLREFIISSLSALSGPRWYVDHLPNDIKTKYLTALNDATKTAWTRFHVQDPLYYTDFPDLTKVIAMRANWRSAFSSTLISKDILINLIRSVEPIRNQVAHNRECTETHITTLASTVDALCNAIGQDHFTRLLKNAAHQTSPLTTIHELKLEIQFCQTDCSNLSPLPPCPLWQHFFDSRLYGILTLSYDLTPLTQLNPLLRHYNSFPSNTPGYRITRWATESELFPSFHSALTLLTQIGEDYDASHNRISSNPTESL